MKPPQINNPVSRNGGRATDGVKFRFGLSALIVACLMVFALSPHPARADDISNAERSVGRVVVILYNAAGDPVGLGHGSGFAIGSSRVVTNAHLLPAREHGQMSIYVVARNAKTAMKARLLFRDISNDLALLQIDGSLPPLAIFDGEISDGADVFALGYPGNVDAATSDSVSEYLAPKDAVRTQGNYANPRTISGIDALLHTAAIARGNSGGPLLDRCGRVIGVNSFTTDSGNGDAPFGFAISNKTLRKFLDAAGQASTSVSWRCLTQAERLAAQQAETAQSNERAEMDRRAQDRADERANAAVQRAAENWTAVAILCGILGIAGLGAGGLLFAKNRAGPATATTILALLLTTAGVGIFVARPSRNEAPSAEERFDNEFAAGSDSELSPKITDSVANGTVEAGTSVIKSDASSDFQLPVSTGKSEKTPDPSPASDTEWTHDPQDVNYSEGL